jgi:predicted Zn finger-like uncharacterized protein
MIVTCKSCQKRYLIEKSDLGSQGRYVRCISCGNSWQQHPVEESVATLPPKPPTFDPGYIAEIPEPKRFSWLISLGGVVTVGLCFYIARGPIIAEWPKVEKIFKAFKISVRSPYEGLILENVTPLQIDQSKGTTYALKGEIFNQTNEVRPLPGLEIIAQGDCKYAGPISRLYRLMQSVKSKVLKQTSKSDNLCVLETWNYRLAETRIFPGEKIAFETPPRPAISGATEISIEF